MKEFAGKHIVLVVENCSVPFDKRVWKEAKALKEYGFRVSVISPKGYNREREGFIVIDDIPIYRYSLPFNVYSKPGYIYEYLKAFILTSLILIRIRIKMPINAIHVANPPEIFFPIGWFCKLTRTKFIFDHHDLSPESFAVKFNYNYGLIYKLMLFMEYCTFQISDYVITTNESLKKVAIKRGKLKEDRISIVRNGPDKTFRDFKDIKKIKYENFQFIVSYIGIMGYTDGVENILKAAEIIIHKKNRKNIKFVLIGNGDQFDFLKQMLLDKKLENYVEFTDRIPDDQAKEILFSSDICLAPDPRNNLNEFHTMNKIAEYMGFGKPIVSFDLDESRYTAGDAALYVANNDPAAFSEAILNLLGNDNLRAQMGKLGKERLESQFTWEHSKQHLKTAYEKIFRN